MRLPIAFALGLLCLASCKGTQPPSQVSTQKAPNLARASLHDVVGSVQIKPGGADGWGPAGEGTSLSAHDEVRTLRGARARIAFQGGTNISLDEDSLISISPAGDTPAVELLAGRLDADVVAAGGDFQVEAAGGHVRPVRGEITFQ